MESGVTKVSLLRLIVSDPPTAGLPDQQTLERLVSAALAAAYPPRASATAFGAGTRRLWFPDRAAVR
jgi:hypothetical protein